MSVECYLKCWYSLLQEVSNLETESQLITITLITPVWLFGVGYLKTIEFEILSHMKANALWMLEVYVDMCRVHDLKVSSSLPPLYVSYWNS